MTQAAWKKEIRYCTEIRREWQKGQASERKRERLAGSEQEE